MERIGVLSWVSDRDAPLGHPELALEPETADEVFELRGDVPEAGRRPEHDGVRPVEIVERRTRRTRASAPAPLAPSATASAVAPFME